MDALMFPAELRALPQWMVAGQGDPSLHDYKRPMDPKSGRWGSPTDPSTWGTFEQAMASPYPLKGFVFTRDDPFAVVDLDTYKANKLKDPQMVRDLHKYCIEDADETYAELSQSGFGTHIIGTGFIAVGANNGPNALEVYSQDRFMICTGKPLNGLAKPLGNIQHLIDKLEPLVRKGGATSAVNWRDLDDGGEEVLSDMAIIDMASDAENGDKFIRLCSGDMSDYGNDWSDADAALIQFLCFYTPNNVQVARLFMASRLADREKAHRPDYVPRTIANMRAKLEAEQIPLVDMSAIKQRAEAVAAAKPSAPIPLAPNAPPAPAIVAKGRVTFPPGLVGEVAEYVLASSTRPVPEIALATAIAVVAGIVGRNYNISNTGLNQYLLLLAKTGTGKESVQSAIDRLFVEIVKTVPQADRFLGPAHFSSGPALVKSFQERPCFVSVLGEFGHRLKAMTHPRANGAEKTLMAAMLDIYAKSGWGQMLRSSVYSDKEKNTELVHAPALTLLGESEPDGFFANLDEGTISSGFLPRFLVIEYKGERPPRNKSAWTSPPPELVTRVSDLCASVNEMERNKTCSVVAIDPDALLLLDKFDERADAEMRGSSLVTQLLWNRAHLKALRLAAVIAVGVNPYAASITPEHARWAIDVIERDLATLLDRFKAGDVGEGDSKLQADLVTVIRKYLVEGSKRFEPFHARGCVPVRFLQQSTAARSAFKNHKLGASRALKDTLSSLIEAGLLVQVAKKQAEEWFKTGSAVYAIGDLWED